MGDAGLIMGGPILREILSAGTVIFAVFATGSQLLAGQITLGVLSENKLCLMLYTGKSALRVSPPGLFLPKGSSPSRLSSYLSQGLWTPSHGSASRHVSASSWQGS